MHTGKPRDNQGNTKGAHVDNKGCNMYGVSIIELIMYGCFIAVGITLMPYMLMLTIVSIQGLFKGAHKLCVGIKGIKVTMSDASFNRLMLVVSAVVVGLLCWYSS